MKIVVSAGGTGGHAYPAFAVISSILEKYPDCEILFVGSDDGVEKRLAEERGLPYVWASGWSINNEGLRWKLRAYRVMGYRVMKLIFRFLKYRPKFVFATGGYVVGPTIMAAHILRIPIFLHEQNIIPGYANRKLSKYANTVFLSFEDSRQYFPESQAEFMVTGNPLRLNIHDYEKEQSRRQLGVEDKKLLLSVGGSVGAKSVNEFASGALKLLEKNKDLLWVHVAGTREFEADGVEYPDHDRFIVHTYLEDLPLYMSAADLVVTRSGALTLAEGAAIGACMVLVPSPNVLNDHQTVNAKFYSTKDAAILIKDEDISKDVSYQLIEELLMDEKRRLTLSENIRKLENKDAANIIRDVMMENQ